MESSLKRRDDIRPPGTVQVCCNGCGWDFWVGALDARLPTGPFLCPSCQGGDHGRKEPDAAQGASAVLQQEPRTASPALGLRLFEVHEEDSGVKTWAAASSPSSGELLVLQNYGVVQWADLGTDPTDVKVREVSEEEARASFADVEGEKTSLFHLLLGADRPGCLAGTEW